jgi:UDP-GlcNAc:undecaprenyl-phosphate GlcNAc-1-phosphate transferase
MSAGIAVIAGGFRFLLFYTDGNPEGALLTAVYVGAVAGFLLFNFGPASIFMGNCGSFLIGFSLAALNLTTAQTYAKSLLSILLFPVLVLAIPIFDTTFVSLTRYFSGRSLSRGGADHTSHRLVAVGLSERQAVLILYGISLAAGIVAYVLYRVGFSYAVFGAALCVLGLAVFGIYLSSVAVYPEDRLPREARDARPGFTLFTELTYKRASLWILVDVLTLATAYYGAYLLRFGGSARWEEQFAIFARSSPLFVAAVLVSLFARGLYRAEWKHFSLHEIKIVLTGATLGTLAATLLFTYLFSFTGFSRGVLVVAWGAAVLSLSGTRVFVRLLAEALRVERAGAQRVLLYGAGAAGRLALTELQTNRERNQHVVGFLDDAVFKHGSTIQGVPVLGGLDSLEFLVRKHRIEAVVVSTRTIADGRQARLAALAARCGVAVYRVSLDVVLLERNAG